MFELIDMNAISSSLGKLQYCIYNVWRITIIEAVLLYKVKYLLWFVNISKFSKKFYL